MKDENSRRQAAGAIHAESVIPTTHDQACTELYAALVRARSSGAGVGIMDAVWALVDSWRPEVRPLDHEVVAAITKTLGSRSSGNAPAIILRTHTDRDNERRTPGPMIVNDLAPEGGVCAFIAMPGVGKTLIVSELARCIASGSPFAGKAVTHGAVLYVCSDAPASTERRMLAMSEEAAARIYTVTELPLLPDGIDALRAAIEQVNSTAEIPVRLVVLDTWDSCRAHSSGGYADQDGGAEDLMRGLRKLASDFKLAVVIVHHGTKADPGAARGTVVFQARCDWIASVEKGGAGLVLKTTKARDGECGPVGSWSIAPVMVGSRPVPTLVEATMNQAEFVSLDREREMLASALKMVEEGSTPTAASLKDALGLTSKSRVQSIAERLRAKGFMVANGYVPTAAGRDSLEEGAERLPERIVPLERCSGTAAEQAVNTERSARTIPQNAPSSFRRSTPIGVERGGTGERGKEIDPEDLFANAPVAAPVHA